MREQVERSTLRYQCHIGHMFNAEALVAEQNGKLEEALYASVRMLRERATLSRRLAERSRAGRLEDVAQTYERQAERHDERAATIVTFLEGGEGNPQPTVEAAEPARRR